MKAKKPKRIVGILKYGLVPVEDENGLTVRFSENPSHLLLPIDKPDALVEQVARALNDEYWKDFFGEPDDETLARAVLRSIGVPLKNK